VDRAATLQNPLGIQWNYRIEKEFNIRNSSGKKFVVIIGASYDWTSTFWFFCKSTKCWNQNRNRFFTGRIRRKFALHYVFLQIPSSTSIPISRDADDDCFTVADQKRFGSNQLPKRKTVVRQRRFVHEFGDCVGFFFYNHKITRDSEFYSHSHLGASMIHFLVEVRFHSSSRRCLRAIHREGPSMTMHDGFDENRLKSEYLWPRATSSARQISAIVYSST